MAKATSNDVKVGDEAKAEPSKVAQGKGRAAGVGRGAASRDEPANRAGQGEGGRQNGRGGGRPDGGAGGQPGGGSGEGSQGGHGGDSGGGGGGDANGGCRPGGGPEGGSGGSGSHGGGNGNGCNHHGGSGGEDHGGHGDGCDPNDGPGGGSDDYVVRGTIWQADGSAYPCARVRAFDRDMRWEELLGETETDGAGAYEIKYAQAQFQRSEKKSADLIVRVYDAEDAVLVTSGTIFNADPVTVVNLSLLGADPRGLSEFDTIVREIAPLLRDVPQKDLTEDDIAFLVSDTGIDGRFIGWLADSARRHGEASTVDQFVFYGLFRQNLPVALADLLALDISAMRTALEKSWQSHIIRFLSSTELDAIIAKLHALQADHATTPAGEGESSSLGDLLHTVLSDADKIRAVAQLYLAEGSRVSEEFFAALKALNMFTDQQLTDIRLALQLGELTGTYLPLVRELQRMAKDEPLYLPTGTLKPYARLSHTGWNEVLHRKQANGEIIGAPATVTGESVEEKIASYASSLYQQMQDAFPATSVVSQLEADTAPDSPFKDSAADLKTFFGNNQSFDLGAQPLGLYLATNAEAKLAGVKDKELLATTLKGVQRVFKLTPDYAGVRTLMGNGFHSAQAVTQLGEQNFVGQYAYWLGGEGKARLVYRKAVQVHNTSVAMYMKNAPAFQAPLPYVIAGAPVAIGDGELEAAVELPTWSKLFGTMESCDCRHCRSLYSPSAYLVDILNFLSRGSMRPCEGPSDEKLLNRRPDIGNIELSCENSDIPMPYVDLVNELLEHETAAREFTVPSPADVVANLDKKIIFSALADSFAKAGYALTSKASVRVESPNSDWTILDAGWAFNLHFLIFDLGIRVTAWPQTSWSAKELKASPEHIHYPAYTRLGEAVYPWNLPFNLPLEETRTYLRHLGVQWYELLQAYFRGSPAAAAALVDENLVVEYLGLSVHEAGIITGAITKGPIDDENSAQQRGPWDFWGLSETGNDFQDPADGTMNAPDGWIEALGRVSILLMKSGLTYVELLDLLDTQFVNPPNAEGPNGRSIAIISAVDAPVGTCNTAKLNLYVQAPPIEIGLTAAVGDAQAEYVSAFSRAHRFVRLARRLGWPMRDLDKAIAALNPKNTSGELDITDAFLTQLSHIQRLSVEKRIPVVKLLSFWAEIDHARYVDHLSVGQPAVPSLYAEMFLGKTSDNPGGSFVFPEDPEQIATATPAQTISANGAAIAAAFGIGADDIESLRKHPLVVVDDKLSLTNLSKLYRHALLAGMVGLPIGQYLTLLRLVIKNPFDPAAVDFTAVPLNFIKAVDRIASSGFTVDDLDYLLRNNVDATSGIVIADTEIGAALDLLRADLHQINVENTFVAEASDLNLATKDADGELTRKKLALLNWGAAEIDTAIAVMKGIYVFETPLESQDLPQSLPAELADRISYDATTKRLRFKGMMSADDKQKLPSSPAAFVSAVNSLAQAPTTFFQRQMRRFSTPVFASEKFTLPADVHFPNSVRGKVYYDVASEKLFCVGVMTAAERDSLTRLSSAAPYLGAVANLFGAPGAASNSIPASDKFLTDTGPDADLAAWVDPAAKPAERFALVLKKLLPYLRSTLSERMVKQRFAEHSGLDTAMVDGLLNSWVPVPGTAGVSRLPAMAIFVAAEFTDSNPNQSVSLAAFPRQFATYRLLHKIAAVIRKFGLEGDQVRIVFEHAVEMNWLDLTQLPLVPADETTSAYTLFSGWSRLADLVRLRSILPGGNATFRDWLAAAYVDSASANSVMSVLSKAAQWPLPDLEALCGANGFNLMAPTALRSEAAMLRLVDAMALLRRLRATAAQCLAWTKGTASASEINTRVQEIKNIARAKYSQSQWLEVAGALRDPLREAQRSALVSYQVAKRNLLDANALYEELWIDVEMSPCMMTTRIRQAISSVQTFVQRTIMNLEKCAALTEAEAREWAVWRKQYRIWEANRKVLLYPENWIEPSLRDDKTPFFKDLENELLQNDITTDTAEAAFLGYLEKLDQVARLEVVGLYEDKDSGKTVLHVIARTFAVPHIYFYRRREGTIWTPWEKVDLDIEGDHLIPVVWNRRLHLFWAIITEKSRQPSKQRANNEDAAKYWEVMLAWSDYNNKGWSPKKLSAASALEHPKSEIDDKLDFSFDVKVSPDSPLKIACYGTVAGIKVVANPASNQGQVVTTNTEYLGTFLKHQPDYWMKVVFEIVGQGAPNDSQKRLIKLQVRRRSDQQILEDNIGLDIWGAAIPRDYTVREDLDCVLVSPAYAKVFVSQEWMLGGLWLKVILGNWTPPAPDAPQPTTVEEPDIKKMQGIGEFSLAPCAKDINVSRVAELPGSSLSPPQLAPIYGTLLRGMSMIEDKANWADALGRMKVLGKTPGTAFKLLLPRRGATATFSYPFSFQDQSRNYHVERESVLSGGVGGYKLRFSLFSHQHMCKLIESLKRFGVNGLLTLENQQQTDFGHVFLDGYTPNPSLVVLDEASGAVPIEDVDFRRNGAYSQYNWELFFHAPFLIATQLSANQRFEEAQKWFHYIFDPTSPSTTASGPERFWKVLPFFTEAAKGVQTLDELIAESKDEFAAQVTASADNPFNPHAIARMRTVAYMKTVVMHYIDNLLAWGDQLFGRDTMESINEATQLYVLAAQILGRRPQRVPPRVTPKVQTYDTLFDERHQPDSLSNGLVELEGYIFPSAEGPSNEPVEPLVGPVNYFCVAPNDKLLAYWDTVADRLFKIRHCMNISGVVRSLPIYEPPIDPALLVKAAAAGVDLSSALSDVNAAVPHYRFAVMLQKSAELCADVKALGGALLAALEKRDAEALSLLRSGQEVDVLKAVRLVREQQAKEASANLEGLNEYQKVVTTRQQYYQNRPYLLPREQTHIDLTAAGLVLTGAHAGVEITAGVLQLFPEAHIGVCTGLTYGGRNIGSALQAFGSALGISASLLSGIGSLSAVLAGYDRRQDDWDHQADLATKELGQVGKQIVAAEIRLAIAERELQNHDIQIENAQETDAYMRSKFTNRELYNWMVGQLSAVYFQSYQLAYDVAKRAERAYRFELGLRDSNFIQFGYWDSLKKGLLAGERLHYDLKRMDVSYLDENRREYEITKHVSLASLDPLALEKLKEGQACYISLPEVLFDLDHPGHYLRRLKSVSVTVPCVTGPYVGVHCTLTLLNSSVRHSSMLLSDKYERQPDDVRFTDNIGAIQSIVTSSGQNDSGLFETSLRDERYLPFEGAGAVSEWRVQLPDEWRQFDYETISDLILHVRYTARDGGEALAVKAKGVLRTRLNAVRHLADSEAGLVQMLSLRQQYPSEWNQLRSGADGTTVITLDKAYFPYLVADETVTLTSFKALALVRDPNSSSTNALGTFGLSLGMVPPSGTGPMVSPSLLGFPAASSTPPLGDWRQNDSGGKLTAGPVVPKGGQDARWKLALVADLQQGGTIATQQRALIEDIVLLVGYKI